MRLNLGLQKLIQGAKDVAAMKIVLAEEQKKLEVATAETMKMLASLEVSSAEARKEGDQARRSMSLFLAYILYLQRCCCCCHDCLNCDVSDGIDICLADLSPALAAGIVTGEATKGTKA